VISIFFFFFFFGVFFFFFSPPPFLLGRSRVVLASDAIDINPAGLSLDQGSHL